MKKISLSIIIMMLVSFGVLAQESMIIETDIFTVEYSETLEQPLWVEYTVLCPNGNADRGGMDFYEVEGIRTSDDEDYAKNVWDKGHLAPAAAFNCDKETLKKTFSYLNSALQHESLNRGVWNRLESFERNLALFYEVDVRIEVLFEGEPEVLPSGATIPSGFRKILRWGDREEEFLFPNSNTKGTSWQDWRVIK